MERLEAHRSFFAQLITASVGIPGGGGRLAEAFAAWLDALRPGGRLLFPLTPAQGAGSFLLVTRTPNDRFSARFLGRVMFIPCAGARDEETASRLTAAFQREGLRSVQSLQRGTPPDETSWCAGDGWWLSTAPMAASG